MGLMISFIMGLIVGGVLGMLLTAILIANGDDGEE